MVEAVVCADAQDTCRTWAEEGECVENPDFMLSSCCWSCHIDSLLRSTLRDRRAVEEWQNEEPETEAEATTETEATTTD